MKRLVILVSLMVIFVLFAGCQKMTNGEEEEETIIDWIDFININEREYGVLYEVAITDDSYIGGKTGEVNFKVADNVNDPEYKTKEGDAAFHEKGTAIYSVEDMPDLIAVKDTNEVNGYRIYQADDSDKQWDLDYNLLDNDAVIKMEIQKGFNQPEVISELTEAEEMEDLFTVLEEGTERTEEEKASPPEEEPDVYHLVFYSDEPVVASYELFHEGDDWYWHPQKEELLPDEIGTLIDT